MALRAVWAGASKEPAADGCGGATENLMEAQVQEPQATDVQAQAIAAPSGITMKQLLEAGVHFGHQTRRWNPKMKPYIFGARNGIYIIDLQKTVTLARDAFRFVADVTARGGQRPLRRHQEAGPGRHRARRRSACGQFYVTSAGWAGC